MDAQTHTPNISFKKFGLEFKVCVTAYNKRKIADIYLGMSVRKRKEEIQRTRKVTVTT